MKAMQEIWEKPWEQPILPKMTPGQTMAVRVKALEVYAADAKKELFFEEGGVPTRYNILHLRSFQTGSSGSRPDLNDMIVLSPLIQVVVGFGPDLTKPQLEQALIAAHAKQKFREPVQSDDRFWLGYQARSLMKMRSKCLWLKK